MAANLTFCSLLVKAVLVIRVFLFAIRTRLFFITHVYLGQNHPFSSYVWNKRSVCQVVATDYLKHRFWRSAIFSSGSLRVSTNVCSCLFACLLWYYYLSIKSLGGPSYFTSIIIIRLHLCFPNFTKFFFFFVVVSFFPLVTFCSVCVFLLGVLWFNAAYSH